jgi:acyl-[acyl-carrier-protein]-phospholipid O-acyltransferase/long-chain-fatty-acid--[acyl-carrier-protein] ligase
MHNASSIPRRRNLLPTPELCTGIIVFLGFWFAFSVANWSAPSEQLTTPQILEQAAAAGDVALWLTLACLFFMPTLLGQKFRESLFRLLGGLFAGTIYRIRSFGTDNLPPGGFLLLPNHMTYVDAIVLQLACPRPIRYIVHESIYQIAWLNPIFRLIAAIPISNIRAKEAVREAARRIQQGEIVCIFPEGELTRTGTLLRLRKGFELIARLAECPVIPVFLDRLWGSIFSFEGGKYFFKWPRQIPQPATVAFGRAIAPENVDLASTRQALMELGEFCFQHRPGLDHHLGWKAIRGLRRNQFNEAVIDGMDHRRIKRGDLLAASIALSRWIKQHCPGERVSVVLPPGLGAIVANVAVTLANKIAVNLNFTAGRSALESAIGRGQILHAISAKPVMKRLEDFPWPKEVYRLEELIPELKPKIALWRLAVLLLPTAVLARILGIPKKGDRQEAVLLFTSGSSGEPKGVVLSHRNVIANAMQFGSVVRFTEKDSLMASLPFFHSFGCTVTLWFPIIEGLRTVTYPTPVDVVKNAELLERYGVTWLVTTPTFLRGYLKRAERAQFKSITLLITGAEKLPRELGDAFEQKFGIPVHEGYGLTETAPVVSTNLPEPPKSRPDDTVQPSARVGSVGKALPGIAMQIRHPETDEPLSLHEFGMLWVRGANIFEGYLNEPERSAEVLRGGWFKTGDLARMDEDGFLYIEGRMSRFSKIAGEMVPHETIEARIVEIFGYQREEERVVAIVGVPDEAKGEALVMLMSKGITPTEIREKLLAAGIPNLWIPRTIRKVEKVPVLGSGKLDLAACKALATGGEG